MRDIYIDNGSDKGILITGCLHGNEPISEIVLNDFIKGVLADSYMRFNEPYINKFNYHVFPRINPTNTRYCPEGIDMNRNFPSKDSNVVKTLMTRLRDDYIFHIDCHETLPLEGFKNTGFYLYEHPMSEIGGKVILELVEANLPVNLSEETNHTGVIITEKSPKTLSFDEYIRKHTLNCFSAVTLETHTEQPVQVRYDSMLLAILTIIHELSK